GGEVSERGGDEGHVYAVFGNVRLHRGARRMIEVVAAKAGRWAGLVDPDMRDRIEIEDVGIAAVLRDRQLEGERTQVGALTVQAGGHHEIEIPGAAARIGAADAVGGIDNLRAGRRVEMRGAIGIDARGRDVVAGAVMFFQIELDAQRV